MVRPLVLYGLDAKKVLFFGCFILKPPALRDSLALQQVRIVGGPVFVERFQLCSPAVVRLWLEVLLCFLAFSRNHKLAISVVNAKFSFC